MFDKYKANVKRNTKILREKHKEILSQGYEFLEARSYGTAFDGSNTEFRYLSPTSVQTMIMDNYALGWDAPLKLEIHVDERQHTPKILG